MKKLPLRNGTHVLVDDRDYPLVIKRTWNVDRSGRPITWINGRACFMHRFILNPLPKFQVDHINGNGLDNRRANLRVVTPGENSCNRVHMNANNRSGYRGVSQIPETKRYRAVIQHNKRTHLLGSFDTAEEAARAYDAKCRELRGSFAVLNFPKEESAA